jgi:hypothetical protein
VEGALADRLAGRGFKREEVDELQPEHEEQGVR